MHTTALSNCKLFFETYAEGFQNAAPVKIVEIGSQDVNGSLRSVAPPAFEYVGVDFVVGNGVDIVLESPYSLPFEDNSVDIVLSSSCFEHSEMFWLVFLEVLRVLKPSGLFYLNAPSNGAFHRYPVDCWRFYPDSGAALITWARHNGIPAVLLESYVSRQNIDQWSDFVGVFLKDERHLGNFPARIVERFGDYTNGTRHGHEGFLNPSTLPEDLAKLITIKQVLNNEIRVP